MGVVQAFRGALGGTFADQWLEVITADRFGELTVVAPGIQVQRNRGRGTNVRGSVGVLSEGSKIFVPENTAAFIFDQSGIQQVITDPGGYEYRHGVPSVFSGNGFTNSILNQAAERFSFGGQPGTQQQIAFVNLREIRGIKFGTRSPIVYHDPFYGLDLEIMSYGSYSMRVVNPVWFVREFLPPNTRQYSFDSPQARSQLSSEFIQAFLVAINSLSSSRRISELPAHAGEISTLLADDSSPLGEWIVRFGLDVVQVGIESIEFSPESRELVRQFASNRMGATAFEGISQHAANVAAQTRISHGVETHGLGDGGGLIFGANLAQGLQPQTASSVRQGELANSPSLEEQIDAVKKLKELLDAGILTQEEFDTKKRQVMGL